MPLTVTRPSPARSAASRPVGLRVAACAAMVAALLLTFALDRSTASAPVQHLYYLPIILAAWALGWRGGLGASLAAVVFYHLANPFLLSFRYEEGDIVQIALFVAVGLVTAKLTGDADRLRELAMTDDLTGLHNLRSFEARLSAMLREGAARGTAVALLVLDVDRLKSLNDTYGHRTGAEAVQTVGRVLESGLPPDGVACRYGGDEFVVAIPECTEARAIAVADELRRAVASRAPVLAGRAFAAGALTISIGVACRAVAAGAQPLAAGPAESGDALFRSADEALYRAKAAGRNTVAVTRL